MNKSEILSKIPKKIEGNDVEWFYEEKKIVITYPKKFSKMESWIHKRIGGPEKIRRPFDEFSTFIWELCDGKNNVANVIQKFDAKFGENVAPASNRVQSFLEKLLRLNLIELI